MKFVAVTSCPTGIAHSEMAAEAIETAAKARGHEIYVEVQGAAGAPPIDAATIADADAAIFAVDAMVRDKERFAHLPTVQVRTREAIDKAAEIIERAEAAAAQVKATTPAAAAAPASDNFAPEEAFGQGEKVRRWLMTGVSYMIPFVVGGGILIALAFMFGGATEVTEIDIYNVSIRDIGFFSYVGGLFIKVGGTAFSMLVPILAGFIAYAMADRPGIAPGIVGGLLANEVGAGFLGGLIAGLLAGWFVNQLKKIPVKGTLRRMMPILVYPVIGTLAVGLVMILIVGEPVSAATEAMTDWLNDLSGTNQALLGIVLGLMMAFDMGGPVNKVAYTFGVAALSAGNLEVMAAVMAAGMTPPLGLALATVLRPKLFNRAEIEAGEAAWVMGASFITEGAIPFAAADPIRVIPSLMAGSAVTGALSMIFNATLRAPHGGIFVIGLIGNWFLYVVAIAIGTVITAAMVLYLKAFHRTESEEAVVEAKARG